MKTFDLQGVEIKGDFQSVFHYIANPENLPHWAHAFKSVARDKAVLQTPQGSTEIRLQTASSEAAGTVDWTLKFPGGEIGRAFSRVVKHKPDAVLYAFTLLAPPVPLEMLEGAMAQQSRTLGEELVRLRRLLENR